MASRAKAKNYTNNTRTTKSTGKIRPEEARVWMLRFMGLLWSLGAAGFTIYFSASGFGTLFDGGPVIKAFGGFIAFGVVFWQLYFYQGYTENKTFLSVSVFAMLYSLWSTWIGLMTLGNTDMFAEPMKALWKLFFAVLIDWTAEPVFLFAVFGKEALRVSDAIGAFFDIIIPGDQSGLYKKRSFSLFNRKKNHTPYTTPSTAPLRTTPVAGGRTNFNATAHGEDRRTIPSHVAELQERLKRI